MGLNISVGALADELENDPEGKEHLREQLGLVNVVLAKAGLPAHAEPERCEGWGAEMFGYSGVHYLRRIAAHLELRGTLPGPGNSDASKDPVVAAYYDIATGTARGLKRLLGKPKPRRQSFDHLILHSDAEGFYVPIDFEDVLYADRALPLAGGMIGSSQRLLDECTRLRDALGIPEDVDPDGDLLWEAADRQGEGTGWERYGVEAFTCVRLLHGAKLSVERGAALVFG
ncbi:MAG TPA: hypothetical protein VM734_31290 [Kofleriaceae bacterium]|jgi:hypothetical protein|nr:hypothetical protein [Kofleriaceae bacterium]